MALDIRWKINTRCGTSSVARRDFPRVVNPVAGVSLKTTLHNPESLKSIRLGLVPGEGLFWRESRTGIESFESQFPNRTFHRLAVVATS